MFLSIFNDICNCWWLYWILPFLLGLLLGWLLWAGYKKYRSMYYKTELEGNQLIKANLALETELSKCLSGRKALEGDIALLRGQLSEYRARENKSSDATPIFESETGVREEGISMDSDSVEGLSDSVGLVSSLEPVSDDNTNVSEDGRIHINKFAALKPDNLQIIEGIGPKMNQVLNDHNINEWSALASNSKDKLLTILKNYGDKYRIIDPSSWPAQAGLASQGQWNELIAMQKKLNVGKSGASDSKVEKIMVKLKILKRWKQDDLKAVEGIGPKIEALLNADGITTWELLSTAEISRLQAILDNAGKRYRLADPKTWPAQAGLAFEGKWDELEALQDKLNGGR